MVLVDKELFDIWYSWRNRKTWLEEEDVVVVDYTYGGLVDDEDASSSS
jgi:hypothetical protein